MDMTPDEIVVRYRQAKVKGEQLKILADLNVCSVDDIVNVLVEHGGYKLDRLSRSRGKAKLLKNAEDARIIADLSGQPMITAPNEPEPEPIPPVVKRALAAGHMALVDEINARRERIEELEAEIAEFEKDIAALKAWKEEHS